MVSVCGGLNEVRIHCTQKQSTLMMLEQLMRVIAVARQSDTESSKNIIVSMCTRKAGSDTQLFHEQIWMQRIILMGTLRASQLSYWDHRWVDSRRDVSDYNTKAGIALYCTTWFKLVNVAYLYMIEAFSPCAAATCTVAGMHICWCLVAKSNLLQARTWLGREWAQQRINGCFCCTAHPALNSKALLVIWHHVVLSIGNVLFLILSSSCITFCSFTSSTVKFVLSFINLVTYWVSSTWTYKNAKSLTLGISVGSLGARPETVVQQWHLSSLGSRNHRHQQWA